MLEQQYKVLVKEKIADSGVNMLRERFSVDVGVDWTEEELAERIGGYHGILIRSATKLTADLIGKADNLRVIGRAGIGVDNVDVEAATKRGIIVANAPQSNIVAAAEHTVALMLSLARNIPQAHASLTAGKWERSKFGGVEVYEKTLGILGFGRIGQLVAARAQGFGMRILAFDPFVSAERFRELGVEKAETSSDVYREADFITIHLPKTPETRGWLDAEAFAQMRDGVRIINCARGELLVDEALKDALDSGKVAGAALDVFPAEPITDYPLFEGYGNVVVTPHLGASTTEAQDRAGVQTAEQVVAALTGGVVSTAVNIPAVSAEDMEVLGPYLPLVQRLGRLATALVEGGSIERVECEYLGHLAARDTRLLTIATLQGVLPATRRRTSTSSTRRRWPRSAGSRSPRPRSSSRATSPTSCGSRSAATAWSAPRSASATARTCWRPGASASTSSSTTPTSRSSATPTCPAWSAASARCSASTGSTSPRPRSAASPRVRTATATTSPSWRSPPTRRCRRPSSTRSSPATASSPAAPSRSRASGAAPRRPPSGAGRQTRPARCRERR